MTRLTTGLVLTTLAGAAIAVAAPPPQPDAPQPGSSQVTSSQQPKPPPVQPIPESMRNQLIKGPPTVTAEQVLAWRKQYPFQSLAGRLDYEARRAPKESPPMNRIAQLFCSGHYESTNNYSIGRQRGESFKLLHEEEVAKFVEQSGFGYTRMLMPTATRDSKYYELPEVKPLSPDAMPELSDDSGPLLQIAQSYDEHRAAKGAMRIMPNVFDMRGLQSESRSAFADPGTFGYVKSIDRVVGFAQHGFRRRPTPPIDGGQRQPATGSWKFWKLVRLELTSLLKHDTPRVYVSEHLPRMDELGSAGTRDLSKFEAESLAKLNAGEELVVDAKLNHIEMFGAIRASRECKQCHEVPVGTLLGAFSYDLRRDPPIKDLPGTGPTQ